MLPELYFKGSLAEWAALIASLVIIFYRYSYPVVVKNVRSSRRDRPEGLDVISEPENVKDVSLEIVALHGLGADANYTWTASPLKETDSGSAKRVHLLKDLLKDDFPKARILSFAYNSNWIVDAPVTSAQQIGDQLLQKLTDYRSTRIGVPIVFIAHSFGGIVIKKALCNPDAEQLVDRTCGIIFLGTPHQGSSFSRLGILAARMAAVLGSDTGLLWSLMSHEQDLTDLDEKFSNCMAEKARRQEKTKIVAFCEKRKTQVFGLTVGQTVNADSARGGHGAETVYIDTDHSGLNKCRSRRDDLYIQLQKQLRNFQPKTKPTLNDAQTFVVKNLPTAKGAAFDSQANSHIDTCLEDTRHELLTNIDQWAGNPDSKRIYWLQGKAGTGKSTIARSVADSFAKQDRLAASFFFNRNEDERRTARRFFTTIAAQINRKLPEVAVHMRNSIEAADDIAEKLLGYQFEKLILRPIEASQTIYPKVLVVVIDALDECEEDQDIKTIIELLSQESLATIAPFKFFITSRLEPPIRSGFEGYNGYYTEYPLHQTAMPVIERDIEKFLKARLSKIGTQFEPQILHNTKEPQLGNWPDSKELQKLVKHTVPLFISAVTACRFIEDRRLRGTPDERLQQFLQFQADGESYNATYRPVLDQMLKGLYIKAQQEWIEDFKNAIGSIITLADPLSATSLANLLDMPTAHLERMLEYLHSVLEIPDDANSPIKIFHQSFRDYLMDSDSSAKDFHIDEETTHSMLAESCLRILSENNNLRNDVCGLRAPGTRRNIIEQATIERRLPPEVQYACLHWVYHLKCSRIKLGDTHQALEFLRTHFLHWLEALSILGRAFESIKLVRALRALVCEDNTSDLVEFLDDAERFILANSSFFNDAPLQLYSSLLIFTPTLSRVRTTFRDQISPWIRLQPQLEEDWSQT